MEGLFLFIEVASLAQVPRIVKEKNALTGTAPFL
jgi:hypothetical protein